MNKTYLDFFNYYLIQFLNDLTSQFPNVKTDIINNYRNLLEGKHNKNDQYVKRFMIKINEHLIHIAKKDETLFNSDNLFLLEGVNFTSLWSNANEQNKKAIWKYLQLLMVLGRKIVPSKDDIMNILNRVGGVINAPDKIESSQKKDENLGDDNSNMLNMLSMASTMLNSNNGNSNPLLGMLGNMMNSENGENPLMNLAQTIQENMAQNTNEDVDTDTGCSEQGSFLNEMTSMAKEMEETLGLENVEGLSNEDGTPNMAKAMSHLMSGDNPQKMAQMIGKMTGKLQKELQSNPNAQGDLLKQATEMMGVDPNLVQNLTQMMGGNTAQVNRAREATRNETARQRLRKKLDEKNRK